MTPIGSRKARIRPISGATRRRNGALRASQRLVPDGGAGIGGILGPARDGKAVGWLRSPAASTDRALVTGRGVGTETEITKLSTVHGTG